jgi:hypothetical protein
VAQLGLHPASAAACWWKSGAALEKPTVCGGNAALRAPPIPNGAAGPNRQLGSSRPGSVRFGSVRFGPDRPGSDRNGTGRLRRKPAWRCGRTVCSVSLGIRSCPCAARRDRDGPAAALGGSRALCGLGVQVFSAAAWTLGSCGSAVGQDQGLARAGTGRDSLSRRSSAAALARNPAVISWFGLERPPRHCPGTARGPPASPQPSSRSPLPPSRPLPPSPDPCRRRRRRRRRRSVARAVAQAGCSAGAGRARWKRVESGATGTGIDDTADAAAAAAAIAAASAARR